MTALTTPLGVRAAARFGFAAVIYFIVIALFLYLYMAQALSLIETAVLGIPVLLTPTIAILWIRKVSPWKDEQREIRVCNIVKHHVLPMCAVALLVSIGAGFAGGKASLSAAEPLVILSALLILSSTGTWLMASGIQLQRTYFYEIHCSGCLYDLSAIEADTCPECNTPITREGDLTTQSSHPAHSQAAQGTDQAGPQ